MRKIFVLLFILISIVVNAQKIDFEQPNYQTNFYDKFHKTGTVEADSILAHSGKYSLRVFGKNSIAATSLVFDTNGKEMTIKGYYRSKVENGEAVVEVSAESNESYPMNHIITSSFRINNNSNGWLPFEINIPLCKQIAKCEIYFITKGDVIIWVDDIDIFIDNKPCKTNIASNPTSVIYKAKEDNRYNADSKFRINTTLTNEQVDELVSLCRDWGRLKYSHPTVKNGNYDWDAVLFELMPLNVQDRTKYINAILSKDDSVDTPYSYYINSVSGLALPYFKNEKSYENADYSDTGIKLLSVFRLWNAIEYYYPYRALIKDWDITLKQAIPDVVKANNAYEYQLVIMKMLGAIEDTHAMIIDSKSILQTSLGNRVWPFCAYKYIDGKFVVNAVMSDTSNIKKGDAIISIGEESVTDFINRNKIYVSCSNAIGLATTMSDFLMSTSKNEEIFTIERNEERKKIIAKSVSYQEFMSLAKIYSSNHPSKSCGKLEDNIFYVDIEEVEDNSILALIKEIKEFDNIIVDMRGYPNSQRVHLLLEQLIIKCELASRVIKLNSSKPGDFIICSGDYFGGVNNQVPNKVIVLVDEKTQSYSEYLTMILQTDKNVITIGSQTAGANGNTTMIDLPYGIQAKFTGVGICYPDGGDTQRVGVRIDEVVKPTIKGVREGRDEVLERAIEIINSNSAK